MEIFTVIVVIVAISIGMFFYRKLFDFYGLVEGICKFVLFPVELLQKGFSFLHDRLPWVIRILLMVASFLGACGFIVFFWYECGHTDTFSEALLSGISLVAFINMMNTLFQPEVSINLPAMVGVGISSFLSVLYMQYTINTLDRTKTTHPVLYWILFPALNLVFFCFSALFSAYIADWCVWAADYLSNYLNTVGQVPDAPWDEGFLKFLYGTWVVISSILLLYATAATFTIVVQEYLATICYGILAFALLVIVALISSEWLHLPGMATAVFGIAAILSTEYIRADDGARAAYKDFVHNFFP